MSHDYLIITRRIRAGKTWKAGRAGTNVYSFGIAVVPHCGPPLARTDPPSFAGYFTANHVKNISTIYVFEWKKMHFYLRLFFTGEVCNSSSFMRKTLIYRHFVKQ